MFLRRVTRSEGFGNLVKGLFGILGKSVSRVNNLGEDLGVGSLHVVQEGGFEGLDVFDINAITVSLDTNEQRGNDVLWLVRLVLSLLEEFVETDSTVELLLGGRVKVGTELGKSSNFTELSELELHGTGNGLGGLVLGSGSDARHGKTDGDSWTLTLVEEFRLQENLSISDGNNIGRNVSGHISGLGLNDWKGSQGTSSVSTVHLGGTLQKTGMEVENITRVGLTTWRTTKQQRHLTVGNSLLGEIIVENNSVLSVVTEEFSHGTSSVWSKELKRSRVGSGSSDNDAVIHGSLLVELSDKLGNGGTLLSNTNVDACKRLLLGLLVDNGINGNSGLSGLTITNDKLTLSTSNRDQGIDGLESGKHRLGNGLSRDDTRGLDFRTGACAVIERGTSINWLTDTVNDTSEELLSDRNIDDSSSTLNGVTFQNITIISKDDNSNIVLFQVECHTAETAGKDNHLSGLYVTESVDTGDTISNGDDGTSLGVLGSGVLGTGSSRDLALEVGGEFQSLASETTGVHSGSRMACRELY
jgi:hypothetical protein